jgi:hypothetical protein
MTDDKLAAFLAALKKKAEKATSGPWVPETSAYARDGEAVLMDNSSELDELKSTFAPTGWIPGVVGYGDCGSHEARWSSGCLEHVAAFDPEVGKAIVHVVENALDYDVEGGSWGDMRRSLNDLRRLAEERAA